MTKPYFEIIRFQIGGIKCDTPDCGYRDDEARFEDYARYLATDCPHCGAPLLTPQDYFTCLRLRAIAKTMNDKLNSMLPTWLLRRMTPKDNAPGYVGELHMNGTGTIAFGPLKKAEG